MKARHVVHLLLIVTSSIAFGQTNPVPLINQPLVPDAVLPGGPQFTLTVNGTGFVAGSKVIWNGSVRSTNFVSASQLTATILASDIATADTATVYVVSPAPGGGISNAAFFEVTSPSSAVTLSEVGLGSGGFDPQSAAVGDFDSDGKLDAAVANAGDRTNASTVSVLLGNGDGTFQQAANYGVDVFPIAVAVGDFNGDGKLDLVVVNYRSQDVSVLLGKGDGTFQAAVNYAVGVDPSLVLVADLNGDGNQDLAVANAGGGVSVLLGRGDGTFEAGPIQGAGIFANWAAVGDFNGDNKLDLVLVQPAIPGNVFVLLGNGDGTFQAGVAYSAGDNPWSVVAGDFNRDGKLDLAVSDAYLGGPVNVLLGNGDGTFQAAVPYNIGGQVQPEGLALGDFNGDGNLDLVVTTSGRTKVNLLLGNGDGTFQAALGYSQGSSCTAAVGDFNRAGRLDFTATSCNNSSLFLQTTTITLSPTSLIFGPHVIGTQSPAQKVMLTNTGGLTLLISGITITGGSAGDFTQQNNCPARLAPGKTCTIGIVFSPTQVGQRSASLSINDNGVGSPQSIPLSGIGVVSGPNASLSTNSLTFATQLVGTTSPAQPVTLTNWGTLALHITGGSLTGDFSQTDNCSSNIAPGASCTINVSFTPKQGGTRNGTLTIDDNAPSSPQKVTLTGTGTIVELDPASLDFGSVTTGQSKSLPTTLTNVGSVKLNITSIAITQDQADFSQTNTCDGGVGAGQSCTITVKFKPGRAGQLMGQVSINDDGGGSPQTVNLSGTGTCGGACSLLHRCAFGCTCVNGTCRAAQFSQWMKDLLFENTPEVSVACGN